MRLEIALVLCHISWMLKREGSDPLLYEFTTLLDQYEKYLRLCDKVIYRATPEASKIAFFALSESRRAGLVARLHTELQLFDEAVTAGDDLTDSSQVLWRFLNRAGYLPCADIFGLIEATDVVKVFGTDQIQIFQNLNFFDWVSAPLESIFCETWDQVTRRDPTIAEKMRTYGLEIAAGQITETRAPGWPWHVVEEVGTELALKYSVHVKYLSPIFHGRETAGVITVNECRKIVD